MTTFTDDFNRANGNLGSNWTARQGSMDIISNEFCESSGVANSYSEVAAAAADFADDHEATITIKALGSSDFAGPAVRVSASGCYAIQADGVNSSNRRIIRMDTTTKTTIGTVNIVPSVNDTLSLRAVGTTIAAYKNGSLVDSVTDATYSTGQPGVFYNRGGTNVTRADDFSATDSLGSSTITDVDTDETLVAGQTTVQVTGTDLSTGSAARIISGGRSIPMTNYSAHATSPTFDVPNLAACLAAGIKFGSVTLEIVT